MKINEENGRQRRRREETVRHSSDLSEVKGRRKMVLEGKKIIKYNGRDRIVRMLWDGKGKRRDETE